MSARELAQSYDSYQAFYRDAYGHALREVRPAGQTGAVMMSVEQDAGDWSDAATPDLVVCMTAKCHGPAMIDVGGGRFRIASAPPGDFLVIPPGYATNFLVDVPHAIRFLAVPYAKLLDLAGPDSVLPRDGDFGRLHAGGQRDGEVKNLLDRLWAESARGSPHGALWADGAILQLAAGLLRMRDEGKSQPTKGGLAPWQVQRSGDISPSGWTRTSRCPTSPRWWISRPITLPERSRPARASRRTATG